MNRLVAGASLLGILAMAAASPERLADLARGGEPLPPADVARLTFMRVALGLAGSAMLVHALLHRTAASWRPFQQLLFAVPIFGIVMIALYKGVFGVRDEKYIWFIREDGPVEYATAIVFLVAAGVAVWALRRARDAQTRAFLVLLALATLFVGLSEVSFGQRIFGIETPEAMAAINRQDEITLHNIEGVDIIVYRYLPLLLLAYALFGGVAARALAASPAGRFLSPDLLRIAPAPWYGAAYFVPMGLFCIKAWVFPDHTWQDQEPAELALSVGFLVIAAHAGLVLGRRDEEAAHPLAGRARAPSVPSSR